MTAVRLLILRLLSLPALAVALALAGCAGLQSQGEGLALLDKGQYEEGLARLAQAVAERPADPALRVTLATRRDQAIAALLAQAERERAAADTVAAERSLHRVLAIDPGHGRAQAALRQLGEARHLQEMQRLGQLALARGDLESAARQLEAMHQLAPRDPATLALRRDIDDRRVRLADPLPQLRSRFTQPISLEFRDASLKMIFDVLAKSAGINFLFDKEVKPDLKATIFVRQVPIEDAVDLLLMQSQLEKKLINDNTVLIYPATPQKSREYQDLVIRTFHLANTDAKVAQELIKTVLKTRDLFVDEKLNALTMRDTRDAVRLAEKLLLAQDLPEPEVVLEVEVLEVSRQRILDLGLRWPNTFDVLGPTGQAPAILDDLKGINSRRIAIAPTPQLRINAQDNDVNTLANPVIRVRNREKARIHIGQRVPVVSATSTPSTQGPVITESIQYLEVGLKLEVEPTVHRDEEVGIKVALEVSKATALSPTQNGSIPVQVDTRNATTVLRLHDGETQILAGLMRNDHDVSGNRIPGLGDLPLVGRLFGSNSDTIAKSELVLSIRPRIVRNLPYMAPHQVEFASGTEASLRASPLRLAQAAELPGRASDTAAPLAMLNPAARASDEPLSPAATNAPASGVALAAGGAELRWEGPGALAPGQEGVLTLHLRSEQPVQSASLQLALDPAVLRLVEVLEGGFLGQGGARTSLTRRGDEAGGRLVLNLGRDARDGATGEGGLLRLKVAALAPAERTRVELRAFSGVTGNRQLLRAPLPPPFELKVARP